SKELQDQLGFTATQTSLPYSVAMILFALFMVPAGGMLVRIGPRLLLLLSGLLIGVGFVLAGLTFGVVGLLMCVWLQSAVVSGVCSPTYKRTSRSTGLYSDPGITSL